MKSRQTVIFISAERSELDLRTNNWRTEELRDLLTERGFRYRPAIGVYKGTKENSFIVEIRTPSEISELLSLSRDFDQECILEMTDGHGWLIFGEDESYLGKLASADGTEEAYTDLGDRLIKFA